MNSKISDLKIDIHTSIIQALKEMDVRRHKSLLVFDKDKFFGIITIGDLQRAIISNIDFKAPISTIDFTKNKRYAKENDRIDDIKELMLAIRAEFMPVLNDHNQMVNIYFWEDFFDVEQKIDKAPLQIPVVIMAGGKGTRLKPLTNVLPKPLIPIGEKTILEEILDEFESIGCQKFYMSVNYKSNVMRYYLENLEHHYDIDFFEEDKPLGTIGSVSLLKGKIDTPFFVSNCDILIDQDYRDVYEYHQNNHNDITIVTAVKSFKIPYGVIETGEDGLMQSLTEKPENTYMINTGVYILQPELINEIPEGKFYHITDLMEKVKQKGGRIGCFPVSENSWKDMGEWSEYLKMIDVL